jgi:hypothetical protein
MELLRNGKYDIDDLCKIISGQQPDKYIISVSEKHHDTADNHISCNQTIHVQDDIEVVIDLLNDLCWSDKFGHYYFDDHIIDISYIQPERDNEYSINIYSGINGIQKICADLKSVCAMLIEVSRSSSGDRKKIHMRAMRALDKLKLKLKLKVKG